MDNKVIFIAFSGDKGISRRETDIYSYYDGDNPEIDDSEHIKSHGITAVEIHVYEDGNHVIYKNYYNADGLPYRFEMTEHGTVTVEEA